MLSQTLQHELFNFIETHSPKEFSRNMRRTILDYLQRQVDVGMPLYMNSFLHGIYDLFELLDVAEDEVLLIEHGTMSLEQRLF